VGILRRVVFRIPREERLAGVADALLDDVGDDRTLDAWAHVAGMARRTFMRAFSAQAGMSFGRWRQQARLFAALEMLAQRKSVTEVAIAVGYDSVSAFIEMFRTMRGSLTREGDDGASHLCVCGPLSVRECAALKLSKVQLVL